MSKIIITKSNKKIEIFDNIFSPIEQEYFFNFVRGSFFKVTGNDQPNSPIVNKQIYCKYTQEDFQNFGMINCPSFIEKVLSKYPINNIDQARINVSNCFEYNTPHVDDMKFTLLYYCNLEWKLEWAGQTLFLNETGDEVEYCSFFVPGRLIVFEGSIPHMIVTPTIYANQHRFSFALQFN